MAAVLSVQVVSVQVVSVQVVSVQVASGLSVSLASIGSTGSTSGTVVSLHHLSSVQLLHRITAVITMTAFGTGTNGYATMTFIDQEGQSGRIGVNLSH